MWICSRSPSVSLDVSSLGFNVHSSSQTIRFAGDTLPSQREHCDIESEEDVDGGRRTGHSFIGVRVGKCQWDTEDAMYCTVCLAT